MPGPEHCTIPVEPYKALDDLIVIDTLRPAGNAAGPERSVAMPDVSDLTITAVRITMLRMPWPQTPWLKGHAFGDARKFLVVDVETKGDITGMGYLFLFRPGIKAIAVPYSRVS